MVLSGRAAGADGGQRTGDVAQRECGRRREAQAGAESLRSWLRGRSRSRAAAAGGGGRWFEETRMWRADSEMAAARSGGDGAYSMARGG